MLSTKKIILDVQGTKPGRIKKRFDAGDARLIGDALQTYWEKFDVDQFMLGLNGKFDYGRRDLATDGAVMR